MFITDRLEITDRRTTADGYLVTAARFARNGIYEYSGVEVGKPAMGKVRVYRPDEEVFSEDAMASFAHRPVTLDHPADSVSAATWKREAVGFTDGRVARDGDFVVVPMMVTDAGAIADVVAGKSELSAGYSCDLEFIDGVAPDGQKYDAVMRNIRGNHVAIVDTGRAGSECRIGDKLKRENIMSLKTVMVDGLQVETTEAGEAAIRKLEGTIAARDTAAAAADAAHATALAAKDTLLAQRDAEVADLKGKVLDTAAIDAMVATRASLVGTVSRIVSDFDCKGKTDAEIKRGVVKSKCGDAAITDKSDAYVDARFDTLVEALPATGDGIRDHLMSTAGQVFNATDAAREEQAALAESLDLNSWRTKKSA